MSVRAFAGTEAEPAFTQPKTAPRPSHLLAPAAGDKRTRDLLAALRPRPVLDVGDLLEAVPFRHDDFREHGLLANLPIGEEATLLVTVEDVRVRPTRRRNLVIVEARVRDESGPGVLVWFNQRYLAKQLKPGMRLSVRGERRGTVGAEIAVRRHELLGADESLTHTSRAGARLPLQREADQPPHRRPGHGPARPRRRCPRLAAVGAAHPPRPAAAPRRAARGAPPGHARSGAHGRAAARVRGAVPAAGRADQPPPGTGAHHHRPCAGTSGRDDRSLPRSRCRSRPRRRRIGRWPRSTATSIAACRCSGCCRATSARGRRWWPCTRCCGPSSATARGR